MQTLYDVLGLGRQATSQQIEDAYHQKLKVLEQELNADIKERNAIQSKALKEAYSILSSEKRRQNYDRSLRQKEQITYQVVEKDPLPWTKIICGLIAVVACLLIYSWQQNKVEKEQKALEVQRLQAEAEKAEQLALIEEKRIEQQRLYAKREIEMRQRQEIDRAMYEGHLISERNRSYDEQNAREIQRDAQKKLADSARAEREAKAKSAAETAAMRRVFSTPVGRNYPGNTPGGVIQSK